MAERRPFEVAVLTRHIRSYPVSSRGGRTSALSGIVCVVMPVFYVMKDSSRSECSAFKSFSF